MQEKILKNTTVTDIALDVIGYPEIPASGQITIQTFDHLLLSSEDSIDYLDPLIDAGDVVVNNGSYDLSAESGKRHIRSPAMVVVKDSGSVVENHTTVLNLLGDVSAAPGGSPGEVDINIGETGTPKNKLYDFAFINTGLTSNKWLEFWSSSAPSNDVPKVVPYNAEIFALTYSNITDDTDIDAEIHVNGTLAYTWEIRNKRTSYKTDFTPVSLNAGDRVSVFFRDANGTKPNKVVFGVFATITSDTAGEGGTQYGA